MAGGGVELGGVEGMPDDPVRQPYLVKRGVRAGDRTKKNQVIAVIWSKDLGEKKSELVTALSNLWIHEENAGRLEALYREAGTSERTVREAQQAVEQDRINVQRVKRTLSSWRLTDEEIQTVEDEARQTREEAKTKQPGGPAKDAASPALARKTTWKDWAKVEVRAPDFDGIVLEMNIAVNDVINDNTVDLFKIGDLSKLRVAANAYEEDVPALERLRPEQRRWGIRLAAMPEGQFLLGAFDQIGQIIDPLQKTALIKGWVDNSDGTLRVGQTVTATVELPPPPNVVTVPIAALIEDGQTCRVFVQLATQRPRYTCRQVTITGRVKNQAYLAAGAVKPGERVVVSGAVELAAALEDLRSSRSP